MNHEKQYDLFVSVNPDLQSRTGHPYHLDCALRKAASSSNLEFVSFGNKEHDEITESLEFVLSVFSKTSWEVFSEGTSGVVSEHVDEFVEALEGLRSRQGEESRIFIYWYMGSAEVFRELCRRKGSLGDSVFCLHIFSGFFFEPSSFTTAHLLHAGLLLEQIQKSDLRYEVIADSEKLIRDLELFTGVKCKLVPAFASQELQAQESERPKGDAITVVYPTDDSSKRGFELFTEFLIRHSAKYEGKIEFKVRLFPGNRKGLRESLVDLSENIEIIEGELSEEQFQALLSGADIVILPYLKELFYYRTSSILYEALALRKPVVVVTDTWLSDTVESKGGGWIVRDSVDSLVALFDSIVSGGTSGIEAKAEEISSIPQVEDLFSTILGLPYEGLARFSFEHELTADEVESYYTSEKEKSRLREDLGASEREIARLERKTDWLESELHRIVNSKTWRYTESLRGWAESVKEWRRKDNPV